MPALRTVTLRLRVKKSTLALISRIGKRIKKWWLKRAAPIHSKNYTQLFAIAFGSMMFVVGSYLAITGYIIPAIKALSETTKTMPADFSFAATGYDTGSGTTFAISSEVRLATSSSWFNGSFTKKKDLTLTNISGATATAGGTMTITVNTKELADAGKLLTTGDDLRIVYSTQSGTFAELPRAMTPAAGTTISTSTATQVAFPLQGDLKNASSSASYALYYNNTNATAPSFPKEKYLSFDGANDFVDLKRNPVAGLKEFTIGFWLNKSSASNDMAPISTSDGGPYFRGTSTSDVILYFLGSSCSGGQSFRAYNYFQSGWHYYGFSVSKTGYVSIFRDGVEIGNGNFANWDSACTTAIQWSNLGDYARGSYLNGQMDEVGIWKRALSLNEISQVMSQRPVQGTTLWNDLNGYWSLDEGTGQAVNDITGIGQSGTLGASTGVETTDPTWVTGGTSQAYSIGSKNATLVCPFNGTTTCVGGITPTTATGAIRYATGSAMLFDGMNDKVTFSSVPATYGSSALFTAELWVKPDVGSYGNYKAILGAQSSGWNVIYFPNSTTMNYAVNDGVGGQNLSWTINDTTGQWSHFALTFDKSNSVATLYQNGVSKGTKAASRSSIQSLVYVGGQTGAGEYFHGLIDEVRISDNIRYSGNFTPSTTPFEPDSHTKLLYHFDNNGDDPRFTGKAKDGSGNGNDGTIAGAQYVSDSPVGNGSFASHQGVFIEEGTTNLITNPSFENALFSANWGPAAFTYATASATFTPSVAKRNSAGPFAAGPMIQGPMQGYTSGGSGDQISYSRGNQISGNFSQNIDTNQGSVVLWITPEWNGNDGQYHYIFHSHYSTFGLTKDVYQNKLNFTYGADVVGVDVSSWTAGATYMVTMRWDTKNTLDGTNYISLSVGDTHTFGGTSVISSLSPDSVQLLGSFPIYGTDAIIEGLTVYRRVLFDGLYGTDAGNGDEINLIYNGGTGKDPTLVTGSWDVVFALPTNASTGALATGTGNAWSMPHSSNLLGGANGKNGFMMDGTYTNDGFTAYSPNKLSNGTFEYDLSSWTATPSFALNDQFNTAVPTTLVSGGVSAPVPSFGADLITNGNMETGNPPSSWSSNGVMSSVADQRTGGTGTQSMSVTSGGIYEDLTVSGSPWLYVDWWSRQVTGTASLYFYGGPGYTNTLFSQGIGSTSWTETTKITRGIGSTPRVYLWTGGSNESRYDDVSVKPFVLSSLISSVNTSTQYASVSAGVTLTAGTQAGIVMNLDSASTPANFIIAYHDGTNVHLEKVVGGVYTSLINSAATYVAGATISVGRDSSGYTLFYNGTQVDVAKSITDAGIISNTRYGLFSTLAGNSFTNFVVMSTVNGSSAEPTGGVRSVMDSFKTISLGTGVLNAINTPSGRSGIQYPAMARAAGKIMIGKFNFSTLGTSYIGWYSGCGLSGEGCGNSFYLSGGRSYLREDAPAGTGPEITTSLVAGTDYLLAVVLRTSGAYYYVKGGVYTNWTLLWINSAVTTATVYPTIGNYSGAFTADNLRVPTQTWLPTPLAYDTFATDSATLSESVGPDNQQTPQQTWTGGTKLGGVMSVSPAIATTGGPLNDGNLLTNGTFDIDSGWTKSGTWAIGNGVASVDGTVASSNLSQNILTTGTWYNTVGTRVTGSGYFPEISWGSNVVLNLSGTNQTLTQRGRGASFSVNAYNGASWAGSIDNFSVKPLTLSSLFSTINATSSNVIADVTIPSYTSGTQAGLVIGLDSATSPTKFLIAYLDGNGKAIVEQNLNGTYSTIVTGATANWNASYVMRVIKDGTTVRLYYNNVLIGTGTCDATITGTIHGVFSTYSGNTFDNFTLWNRSGYADAPFEDLTATRDTTTKYAGAASLRIIAGSYDDNYTQTINVGNTDTYNFSAYAYTTGAAVTSSDLSLYYGSSALTTTYTSVGSGWYRLDATATGVASNQSAGVRVKAGKTVYLDNFTVVSQNQTSSVAALAAASKIYAGGYAVTSQQWGGVYQDITVTAGQDLVIRGIANSDGASQPRLVLYDQTNGANIGALNGTTTSTKSAPDVLLFTGEAPTGCTSIRVFMTNASGGSSVVNWHQVEVYDNKIDNPSMQRVTGFPDPWVPDSWGGTSFGMRTGDAVQGVGFSDSSSIGFPSGTSGKYIRQDKTVTTTFQGVGAVGYGDGTSTTIGFGTGSGGTNWYQSDKNLYFSGNKFNSAASWKKIYGVENRASSQLTTIIYPSGAASGTRYVDDVYAVSLDDVSLTVTPATQTNSTEVSGLRVDGADTLTQPVTGLSATNGVIKFKFTPRHDFSVESLMAGGYMFQLGSGSDYIRARVNGTAIQVQGMFNSTLVAPTWDTPVLNAGTTYAIELLYTAGDRLVLKVNGVEVASKGGVVAFGTTPTIMYFGNIDSGNGNQQYDGTFTAFSTTSVTANTTAPYYKFGTQSAKIQAFDMPDQYVTTATTSANGQYTLTAYAYDATTGNVGGIIDNTIATLASASASLTTTYTDMGGGWWRLSNVSPTILPGTYNFGVQVQAGKTIYVDGVQLEQKAFVTTYCDGSLGTGYVWTGTANASTSTRTGVTLNYSSAGTVNLNNGTVSFWWKPNYADGTVNNRTNLVQLGSYFQNNSLGIRAGERNPNQIFWYMLDSSGGSPTGTNEYIVVPITKDKWYHVVATFKSGEEKLYFNNAVIDSRTGTYTINAPDMIKIGNGDGNADSTISDFRIYDQALTGTEVSNVYYGGLQTHSSSNERVDRYVSTGTYTSAPLDLGANGAWGTTPIAFTNTLNGGTVSYETRSSSDGSTWGAWQAISGNNVQSDSRRYLEWRATINTIADMSDSPVINGMTVKYTEDTTPPVNPDQVALGFSTSSTASADLTTATWYNFPTPKFTWNAGADDAANGQSSSGIAGYHVLLTTDQTASPSANTSNNCYEYVDANTRTFTVGSNPSRCSLSDGTYYLRLQTKDNSGNTATPVTLFTYKYDGSNPKSPTSVSSTVVGYTSQNTFTFYWPVATDQGPSGVAGYQYKTGATSGAYSDWTFTTSTEAPNITAYQEGQNFFFVRTIDNAGNPSASTSNLGVSPFYYNASAPTQPTNVVISPDSTVSNPSANNVFSVTWDKPATYSGEIAKYYYCVNCTPSLLTMTQATPAQTAARTLTNLSLATQQGKNTLYIVAEDNNINSETAKGNVNFDAYASVDFYASTIAPAAPTSLTVSDASDRDSDTWRLTLAWKQPTTGGTPVRYDVFRSTDNVTFAKNGSTTSTAYTDADLSQSIIYYYQVSAIDNAGASSIFSNTVNMSPEGKYSTPPVAGGVPSVVAGSTTAMVSWTTSREAFGSTEYGKTDSYGSNTAESIQTKSHAIKISGLTPGESYHFRVQNLDDSGLVGYDRSAAYSGDYTFTTLSSPSVTNVLVTDQTLSSVVVNWSTSSLVTSMVEYGPTTDYGTELPVPTNPTDSLHSGRIADLDHSTTYHFRIRGVDVDGNDIISDDYTFATLTYPKVTAMVLNTDQGAGGTSVVLAWATNVATTGQVDYQGLMVDTARTNNLDVSSLTSMTQAQLATVPTVPKTEAKQQYSGQMETKHVMRLADLEDGAIYVFTISGRDAYGNEVVADPIRFVTGNDTRPPVISNVIIETPMSGVGSDAKTSIIVSWDTDEPALGQVLWGAGTGSEYSSSTEKDQGLTTKHVMVIRDLQPTSSYHLKITSSDKSGNLATSRDTVVVTPTSQQAAFDVILKNLGDVFGFLNL